MKKLLVCAMLLSMLLLPAHAEDSFALPAQPNWGATLSDLVFSMMSMPEDQLMYYNIADPDPYTGAINVTTPPATLFGQEWTVIQTYGSAGLCRIAYECAPDANADALSVFYDFTDALTALYGGEVEYYIDWQDDDLASKYSARIDKGFEAGAICSISVDIFTQFDPEVPDGEDTIYGYLTRMNDGTCSMWFSFEASDATIELGASKPRVASAANVLTTDAPTPTPTATPTSTPVSTPVAMQLEATSLTGSIRLTWSSVSGAAKYRIYRAKGINGELNVIDTVTSTSYSDYGWYADYFNAYQVEALSSSGQVIGRSSTATAYGPSRSYSSVTNPPVTNPPVTPEPVTPVPVTPVPVTPTPQVWGEWSGWTDIPAYESSTRQVETDWFEFPIVELRYDYSRWRYIGKNGNAWYAPSDYSDSSNYLRGGEWEYTTTTQPKTVKGTAGGTTLYEGNWYHESVREEIVGYEYVQLWRYRDLQ